MREIEDILEDLRMLSVWNSDGEVPDEIFWRRIELQLERIERMRFFQLQTENSGLQTENSGR